MKTKPTCVLFLLFVCWGAQSAFGDVCERCRKYAGSRLCMVGPCSECGEEMPYLDPALCPDCSYELGECEMCRAFLPGATPKRDITQRLRLDANSAGKTVTILAGGRIHLLDAKRSEVSIEGKSLALLVRTKENSDPKPPRAIEAPERKFPEEVPLPVLEALTPGEGNVTWRPRKLDSEKPGVPITVRVQVKPVPASLPTRRERRAVDRANLLREGLGRFQLEILAEVPNQPAFGITFVVPVREENSGHPDVPMVSIKDREVLKIGQYLYRDGFLADAEESALAGAKAPYCGLVLHFERQGLDIKLQGHNELAECLPLTDETIRRMQALRKVLDGDPGKAMDKFLESLTEQKRKWEQIAKTQPATGKAK
jgi:hypothetical protein